jgi:RNA polymerase sigma factor (sigma-70 family)
MGPIISLGSHDHAIVVDLTALVLAPPTTREVSATASRQLQVTAVADVHERRGRELFGLCRRLGLDEDEANDAVQETFLRMWTESSRGTVIVDPEGWAFRVTYRLAMDHHRLGRLAHALADRLMDVPVRDEVDPADRMAVWAAVDKLPPRQRAVLYLRYRADLDYERIGTIMGITANGARNDASAATSALRRRLAPTEDRQ